MRCGVAGAMSTQRSPPSSCSSTRTARTVTYTCSKLQAAAGAAVACAAWGSATGSPPPPPPPQAANAALNTTAANHCDFVLGAAPALPNTNTDPPTSPILLLLNQSAAILTGAGGFRCDGVQDEIRTIADRVLGLADRRVAYRGDLRNSRFGYARPSMTCSASPTSL